MNQDFKDFFNTEKHGVIDVSNDSKQVAQAVKEMSNGKRGIDLIVTDTGELVAGPSYMIDKMNGTKAAGLVAQGWA